ncbi:MAG: hypothetical protein HYR87_07415 [Thaumarchaeota archaeon]|nr:hypothetical protein [Nitrososphaerota archaeon]
MNTPQVRFSDIYNALPANLLPTIETKEVVNFQNTDMFRDGYIKVPGLRNGQELKPTFTRDRLIFEYKDSVSRLVLSIVLTLDESKKSGRFFFETVEPTTAAAILSTRIIYSLIKADSLVFVMADNSTVGFKIDPLPESEMQQLLYKAKLYRKLQFIEKCFEDQLESPMDLPKEISSDEIAHLDILFRGITRGNVYADITSITLDKESPSEDLLKTYERLNQPSPVSFDLYSINMFNYVLKTQILGILPHAKLTNHQSIKQYKKDSKKPLSVTFIALDNRVIFHFKEYIHQLAKWQKKLLDFKEELRKEECEELACLVTYPITTDISYIEASEIAIAWLYGHIPTENWPATSIRQTELGEDGKYWQVIALLTKNKGDHFGITIPIVIDRKTGEVVNPPSMEELMKQIASLYQ